VQGAAFGLLGLGIKSYQFAVRIMFRIWDGLLRTELALGLGLWQRFSVMVTVRIRV